MPANYGDGGAGLQELHVTRLRSGDTVSARVMFAMMAAVFGEDSEPLGDHYLTELLGRESFWAYAAFAGTSIVGGLTAHTLPMTRSPSSEVFIYDLAVRPDHQRMGVGSRLLRELCTATARAGIRDVFVPADEADEHAIDFYRALGGVPSPVTFFTFADRQDAEPRDRA
jgi:aminoglycoside 3-N-acetyltransferase I